MDMQPVASSNIEAIGYDPATSAMRIRFLGGATYEYAGVSAEDHSALMSAQSKGGRFAQLRHKYIGKKVGSR